MVVPKFLSVAWKENRKFEENKTLFDANNSANTIRPMVEVDLAQHTCNTAGICYVNGGGIALESAGHNTHKKRSRRIFSKNLSDKSD